MRAPWLILSNCQANGLGNCLGLGCDGIDVETHDPASFAKHRGAIAGRLERYERVLVARQVARAVGFDTGPLGDRLVEIPTIHFDGFHPDICDVSDGAGGPLRGPLGNYHSLLAVAGFLLGYDVDRTVGLFSARHFKPLGFMDQWDLAWAKVEARFARCGIPLGPSRSEWSRTGTFMHTVNHPRIHVLWDLARLVAARCGVGFTDDGVLPHDNLATAAVYPVYPDIASALGVQGSTRFKLEGEYQCIGLEEFVSRSFRAYAASSVRIRPMYEGRLAAVQHYLREST